MKAKKIFMLFLFVSFMFLLVGCTTTNKPHTHTFGTEWATSETHHWHSATCEHEQQVSDKAKHDWSDAVVESNASCTEAGKQILTCKVCGYAKEEKIDALGHSGEALYTWTEDNSSCTATFDCIVEGCDYVVTETATATVTPGEGIVAYTAEFENDVFESQYKEVPVSGEEEHTHTYSELIPATEADCDTAGNIAHYTCSGCELLFVLNEETNEYEVVADVTVPATGHSHSSQWSKNDNEHWHECSCGDKADKAEHSGGTATETAKAVCATCGAEYGDFAVPKNNVTVYFQNNWKWTNVSIYLWDENNKEAVEWPGTAMELVGVSDKDYKHELYAYTFDANTYVGFVINGTKTDGVNTDKTPDLLVADYLNVFATDIFYMSWDNDNSCNLIGHFDKTLDQGLHIHESGLKSDAEKHWFGCECGFKKEEAVHTFDEGSVTTAATCTSKGVKTFKCTICEFEKTEEIDIVPHQYGELIAEVPATCTTDGKEAHYKCSECHKFFQLVEEEYLEVAEEDLVIVAGHSWVDATCDTAKTCSACDATEGEALGHTYGAVTYSWGENRVNCTATRVCANDSAHVETETVNVELTTLEPTEEENGWNKYVATFENSAFIQQVYEEVIPAIGHVHSYGELVLEVAADCENAGKEAHYVCGGCHKLFQLVDEAYVEVTEADLVIDAKGHEYGELVSEVVADCENAGKEAYYECSECHKFFQLVDEEYLEVSEADLVIEALGHSYKLEADENNHWQECSACHDVKDEAAHTGGTATETEQAECEVCHEKYGDLLLPEVNMVTVYFQNNWWWTNINIYPYTDDETYLKAWPGEPMKLVGTYDHDQWKENNPAIELYAFTFDANKYSGFIINGNNGSKIDQTPNMVVSEHTQYLASDCFYMLWDGENSKNDIGHCFMSEERLHLYQLTGEWATDADNHWQVCGCCNEKVYLGAHKGGEANDEGIATCSTCGNSYSTVKPNMVKIYLQNNWNWTNVHIYLWGNDGDKTAWPGDAMVKEGTMYDKELYTFEFDANKYTKFIINGYDPGAGKDNQTCDLSVTDLLSSIETQCFYFEWNGTLQIVELKGFTRP